MLSRIAIVGANGQLGQDLVDHYGDRAIPLLRRDIDLTREDRVAAVLNDLHPDAVINAAAYNLVDQAESEPEIAFQGNAFAPLSLARACAQLQIPFLHVSTDYVFGADRSRQRPYAEDDLPGPVSVYGASKLAGEQLVQMTAEKSFVVRTCGLYGRPAPGGKGNFVQTILRLATQRDEIRVVEDQRCSPTSTLDLAASLAKLLETEEWGLYHAVNAGDCSWFEFASEIVSLLGLPTRVTPTVTAEFPRPARRPGYSVLATQRLDRVLDAELPHWKAALAAYLEDSSRSGIDSPGA